MLLSLEMKSNSKHRSGKRQIKEMETRRIKAQKDKILVLQKNS